MQGHEEEAKERWGNSDAYKESAQRTKNYSKSDYAAARIDQEAATELFVYAFGNGLPINSEKAQEAVLAHREAISKWFYQCDIPMQKQLALLYISDVRFKEYYEGRVRGLARYVHDAILAQ